MVRRMVVGGLALLALSPAFADGVPSVAWEPERKKIVSFGWEWGPITPAEYVKYADRIDRTGLDGVGVYVKAKDASGKTCGFDKVFLGKVEFGR